MTTNIHGGLHQINPQTENDCFSFHVVMKINNAKLKKKQNKNKIKISDQYC